MSEAEPTDPKSSPDPATPPLAKVRNRGRRVSSWLSRARAFMQPRKIFRGRKFLPGRKIPRAHTLTRRRGVFRARTFMQLRRKLWAQRSRKQILFPLALILVAVLIVWLRISGNAPVWLATIGKKAISARLSIRTHHPPLPEVLVVVGLLVILVLWKLPKLQAALSRGLTDKNRFDRENEARKTLAQIIAGVFVLGGLYSSLQTFSLQAHTLDLQREGQITDRFTKAIDQLGAVQPGGKLDKDGKPKINLEVRLGGIYALERIARDSPKDHWTIMEVLTAYVRENSPTSQPAQLLSKQPPPHVRADIQAILTVIGRRDFKRDQPLGYFNLNNTKLSGADLADAYLNGAHLIGADLSGADLTGAMYLMADLSGADLNTAHLNFAHLKRARLTGADLTGADLTAADLTAADLSGADLSGA